MLCWFGLQIAYFLLKLDTVQFTESLQEPRVFGSQLSFFERASIVVNHHTGRAEGTSGALTLAKPLRSLDEKWGFGVDGFWNLRTRRTYCGAQVCQLASDDGFTKVPIVYDVRNLGVQADLTRSFGKEWKVDLTAAVGGYAHQYGPTPDAALTSDQAALLKDRILPRSEDAAYVLGFFRAYKADFRVLKNIDTFELSEDYQVGPLFQAGVRYALPLLNSHFVELGTAIRYRWLAAENVLTATLAAAVRVVPGGVPLNRHLAGELVEVSPPFEGGRWVARVLFDVIKYYLDNRLELLGGGNGLRGAPAELLQGINLFLANLEYRTRPFELRTMFVGMVLFYDLGSAFGTRTAATANFAVTHTLGVGLRILVPQFNFVPIRVDFGFVFGGPQRAGLDRFSASYGQVTDLSRPAFLDEPL